MRIVIVGPGAIGCLFAGLLQKAGRNVSLLDNDPARAARIAADGVRIESGGETDTFAVDIAADPADIRRPIDCLCICVKAYDTVSAIRHARPLVSDDTLIVSLQNGLGNAEKIESEAPGHAVACAVTSHGSTLLGPGHVRHAGVGPTAVAPVTARAAAGLSLFADTLESAGINTIRHDDCPGMLWSKAVVNAAVNPVTAVNNVNNGSVLERPDLRDPAMAAAAEATAVAAAAGISLLFESATEQVEIVCGRTANNISSMLQDVRLGRQTEIDAITGAIVEKAHELGVDVPVNEGLLEKVRAMSRASE